MTQHLLEEDNIEDRTIMRRLFTVIGGFLVFTIVLAVSVGVVMG